MKHLLLATLALMMAATAVAQPGTHHPMDKEPGKEAKITDLVSNLTPDQKKSIDLITQRSSTTIKYLRQQLHAVRDSVRIYLEMPGNQSKKIFPLFEQEGMLQTELSKAYYRTRQEIDEVLTPEQHNELRGKMKDARPPHRDHGTPHPRKGDHQKGQSKTNKK